jgi:hypothetical protein
MDLRVWISQAYLDLIICSSQLNTPNGIAIKVNGYQFIM